MGEWNEYPFFTLTNHACYDQRKTTHLEPKQTFPREHISTVGETSTLREHMFSIANSDLRWRHEKPYPTDVCSTPPPPPNVRLSGAVYLAYNTNQHKLQDTHSETTVHADKSQGRERSQFKSAPQSEAPFPTPRSLRLCSSSSWRSSHSSSTCPS